MKRPLSWLLVGLLSLVLPTGVARSESMISAAESLEGLRRLGVQVEDFIVKETLAGFVTDTFRSDVELKLRLAGIKVLTEQELLKEPGAPHLYVTVSVMHENPGEKASFGVDVKLRQLVTLERSRRRAVGTTWNRMSVGYGDAPYVRESMKQVLDLFLNDWLSVNPKR